MLILVADRAIEAIRLSLLVEIMNHFGSIVISIRGIRLSTDIDKGRREKK
jgi:hypothetical protein